MDSDPKPRASDANSFAGRYLVEIVNWDWAFHLGLSPDAIPEEHRFQGGLIHTRGVEIEGRIIAPRDHAGKAMAVWLSPMETEVQFGEGRSEQIGQFHQARRPDSEIDFEASALIPEASLSNVLSCLGSVWKYIHIWTAGDPIDGTSAITDISFSRNVHRNLCRWIDGD